MHSVTAQTSIGFQRDRGREIISQIKEKIKDGYYDPTYHGVDLDARYRESVELINAANSSDQIYSIIARFTLLFDDSHTWFNPPGRFVRYDYGWEYASVGNACYVTGVDPSSDASAKGLKEGDEVLSINGMSPKREDLWLVGYYVYRLHPLPVVRVSVRSPGGQPRQLELGAKTIQRQRVTNLADYNEAEKYFLDEELDSRDRRHRYVELPDKAFVWKMPSFNLPKDKVDDMMSKARKFPALILDLRGNGGGAEETLLRMLGNVFDHDVKIGELIRRKERKPLVAKTKGKDIFTGKLVVLIDSGSGSSSELFARVIQTEKRGTVIGDRSAGAVMRSRGFSGTVGIDTVVFFGASITDADLIMTDGKSLEKVGVAPDELVLPSAADLAARRDPVLSRAGALAGFELDAVKAGAMFPIEWKTNRD
jgi:carboxyl-terminal processing protease